MDARSSIEKKEIISRMKSFPYCGFSTRVTGNIIYHKSFVGRDFKANGTFHHYTLSFRIIQEMLASTWASE